MVLLTKSDVDYLLEDKRGQQLIELLRKGPNASRVLDIYGDGKLMLPVSGIGMIMTDHEFEVYTHKRQGDWKCDEGFWHRKHERCGHKQEKQIKPIDLSIIREAPGQPGTSPNLEKLRRNMDVYRRTGEWPLDDLSDEKQKEILAMREREARRRAEFHKRVAVDRMKSRRQNVKHGNSRSVQAGQSASQG